MLVLALGVAVNVAVFTVANAVLFRGFAGVPAQDRLVYLTTTRDCCVSYQDLLDWRAGMRTLDGIAAVADLRVAFDTGAGATTATATEITANTFGLLGVEPALGRGFRPEDDAPGAAAVALLSEAFWRTRLSGDARVLGRLVRLNGVPTVIVGVMPAGFTFPQHQDLWVPMGPRAANRPRDARGLWFAVARLAPGATAAAAQAEITALGASLADQYPATNAGIQPLVRTFSDLFVGPDAAAAHGSVWAAVIVLLTIACTNVATLMLARSLGRTREAGVRIALGAGLGRIVRQQLFESAILAAGSSVVGAVLGRQLLWLYRAIAVPPTQPWATDLLDLSVSGPLLVYVAVVSVLSALVVGAAPALRLSSLDVIATLRDGDRGAVGARGQRWMTAVMLGGQVMLAVLLLSGAGVLARSFLRVEGRDLGYVPSYLLVTLARLPESRYPDTATQLGFYERVASRLRELPAVQSVAFSDSGLAQRGGRAAFEVDQDVPDVGSTRPQVRTLAVSPAFFDTLGAPLVQGRDFDVRDGEAGRLSAIVNERFARLHWRGNDPVGRRLRVYTGETAGPWLTVVGVARDLRHGDPAQPDVEPVLYLPLRQRPTAGAWIVARTRVPPAGVTADVRRVVQAIDPEIPVWLGPFTLADWLATGYWHRGVNAGLVTAFAVAALGLATLGLFAVVAHDVARRSRELAVRIALGATHGDIARVVAWTGLSPGLAGLVTGLLLSLGTNRLLSSQLVEVTWWDPLTLLLSATSLALAAVAGVAWPVWRACRTQPIAILRLE
jgi:predicted permease